MPPAAHNTLITLMAMFVRAEGHQIHISSRSLTESAKDLDHQNEDGLCVGAGALDILLYARDQFDTREVDVADEDARL